MKSCTEIQHLLYLYNELTSAEKTLVDNHLHRCEGCSALFESFKENQALIQRAAQIPVVPQHAGKLTSNIMGAIHLQIHKKQSALWIKNIFFRYSMVAVSLGLIMVFGAEQLFTTSDLSNRMSETKTVTLNSPSLMKVALDRRRNPDKSHSFYMRIRSESLKKKTL